LFAATLRSYPEIATFRPREEEERKKGVRKRYGGRAGVLIGQIITISQPLKATLFLCFLFAVGYGSGKGREKKKGALGLRASAWDPVSIVKLAVLHLVTLRVLLGVAEERKRGGEKGEGAEEPSQEPSQLKVCLLRDLTFSALRL